VSCGAELCCLVVASKGQRSAKAKRDRKPTPAPERDLWSPPPINQCDEVTDVVEPDPKNRVIQRRVLWNNQLVNYAIAHATLVDGEWNEVASIDCCHNRVHRHKNANHDAAGTIRIIYSQLDVQSSFDGSFDEIYDGYLEFKDKQ